MSLLLHLARQIAITIATVLSLIGIAIYGSTIDRHTQPITWWILMLFFSAVISTFFVLITQGHTDRRDPSAAQQEPVSPSP